MKKFKILVPKPMMDANSNLTPTAADEIINAADEAMEAELARFVENGWAIETKAEEPDEVSEPVKAKVAPKKKAAAKKPAPKKAAAKKPAAKKKTTVKK